VYLSGGEVAPAGINMLDFILFVWRTELFIKK
jgi:hypothetical protein